MTAHKIISVCLFAFVSISVLTTIFINAFVYAVAAPHVFPEKETKPDYILVLGAGLNDDGSPGRMLRDRLNTAIALYEKYNDKDSAPTVIISGDRTLTENKSYDEVSAMHSYLLLKGVPDEAILEDPYGFSTAESIANLQQLPKNAHIAIITQEYHLYRALFIAYMNDYNISGYAAPSYDDHLQFYRDLREIAARMKDFAFCLLNN